MSDRKTRTQTKPNILNKNALSAKMVSPKVNSSYETIKYDGDAEENTDSLTNIISNLRNKLSSMSTLNEECMNKNKELEETLKSLRELVKNKDEIIKNLKETLETLTTNKKILNTIHTQTEQEDITTNTILPMNTPQDRVVNIPVQTPSDKGDVATTDKVSKMELEYLKSVISHKVEIITELRDKNTLLYDKVNLIEKLHANVSCNPFSTGTSIVNSKLPHKENYETTILTEPTVSQSDIKSSSDETRQSENVTTNVILNNHHKKKSLEQIVPDNVTNPSDKRKNKNIIFGSKTTDVDFAVEKKKWLFVTKYKNSYTKENLDEYLREEFPENGFTVEQISNNGTYNSFKVGFDESLFESALNPDIWPSGIQISEYLFRNRQQWKPHYRRKYSIRNRRPPYNKHKRTEH